MHFCIILVFPELNKKGSRSGICRCGSIRFQPVSPGQFSALYRNVTTWPLVQSSSGPNFPVGLPSLPV